MGRSLGGVPPVVDAEGLFGVRFVAGLLDVG